MFKRMQISEVIFKALAYVIMILFALFCLYPFVYAISAAISGGNAMTAGDVMLFPIDPQFDAFISVFNDKGFWVSYANTLFVTFFGTLWAVGVAMLGAYALSKKRLAFRTAINFFLVFTLWFTAGMVPQYLNYKSTLDIMHLLGINDDKWLVVIAMGMAAFNVVLLRNAFEGVSKEIEEAAVIDGATEFQLFFKVYIPMCKATIATVTLFFAVSRWNGYFWARTMVTNQSDYPLQVYIRKAMDEINAEGSMNDTTLSYVPDSIIYAMIVCAIVPIIIIYPYIQKYFAKGVNMGGVKE